MKNLILLATLSLFIFGCGMNPNKEARIQQLESDLSLTLKKVDKLETRILLLENVNQQLKLRKRAINDTKNIENAEKPQ